MELSVLVGEEAMTFPVTLEEYTAAHNDQNVLFQLVRREQERRSIAVVQLHQQEKIEAEEPQVSGGSERPEEVPSKIDEEKAKEAFNWPQEAVLLFLEVHRDRQPEFQTGIKKHNKLWDEIAREIEKVNPQYKVSGLQCQSKMSGLQRTYKNIKDANCTKKKTGNHPSSWAFFSIMDSLYGKTAWASPSSLAGSEGPLSPQAKQQPNTDCDASINQVTVGNGTKKRRVEVLLENYVGDLTAKRDEERAAKERHRLKQDKSKERRHRERQEQRKKMHEERLGVQKSLIDILAKLVNK